MKIILGILIFAQMSHAAMQLNGVDSQLLTKRDGGVPFRVTGAVSKTFSLWLKRYDTNAAYFLSETFPGSPQVDGSYSLKFNNSRTNCVEFSYEDDSTGATHTFSSEPNIGSATNVWMHVGFTYTYSAASSAGWWINGVHKSGSWTVGSGTATPLSTSGTFRLGCGNQASFFNGEIGEVSIYQNTLLNNNEMQLLASKVKRLPLQLRSQVGDGYANGQLGVCANWPLDQIPAMTVVSTTVTNLFDISHYGRFTPVSLTTLAAKNTVVSKAEQVCSYPPNE